MKIEKIGTDTINILLLLELKHGRQVVQQSRVSPRHVNKLSIDTKYIGRSRKFGHFEYCITTIICPISSAPDKEHITLT